MPLLMTRGTASLKSLGFGASGESSWIFSLSTATAGREYKVRSYSIDMNSSGIVCSGRENVSRAENSGFNFKLDLNGNLIFQQSVRQGSLEFNFGIEAVSGLTSINGDGSISSFGWSETANGAIRVNFSSTGSIIDAVKRSGDDNNLYYAKDSSNNFYIVNRSIGASGSSFYKFAKYNSSSATQFVFRTNNSWLVQARSINVDSSNNIYVTGTQSPSETGGNFGGPDGRLFIVKYDSSGSVLWQRALFNSPGFSSDQFNRLAVDSSGNVHVFGYTYPEGRIMCKYDSSGTLLYQKTTGNQEVLRALVINGNLFTLSFGQFCKYDLSGNIIFKKSISSNKGLEMQSMISDGKGNIIIGAWLENGAMVLKLPLDGSKTGTYVVGGTTVTYSTEVNPTMTTTSLTQPTFAFTHSSSTGSFASFTGNSTTPFEYTPTTLIV